MSERTPEQFMAAVRGIPTYHVIAAMNLLTPGIDWQKCSKGLIAKNWSQDGVYGYRRMADVKLDRLAAMAKARAAGDRDWRKA